MSLKTNDPNRKFEYCITHLSVKEPDEPHTYFHHKANYGILDGLGEDGWELVQLYEGAAYLKREKT